MKKFVLLLCTVLTPSIVMATDEILLKAYDYYQDHVVSIEYREKTVDTVTGDEGTWDGTGFIIDPELGYVVTNAHVASHWMISNPYIVMYDGTTFAPCQIKIVHSNPTGQDHDFAILQIMNFSFPLKPLSFAKDPKTIPAQTNIGVRSSKEVSNKLVFGKLVDKYYVTSDHTFSFGCMHLYTIVAPAISGFSGAPAFMADNKIIGVLSSGDTKHAHIVPIAYVLDQLEVLKQNKKIFVHTLGIDFAQEDLNVLKILDDFNDQTVESKLLKNPDFQDKLLTVNRVNSTLVSSNAIQYEDVLKTVNGQPIGSDYYLLQKMVNEAGKTGKKVHLEFDRSGQSVTADLRPVAITISPPMVMNLASRWILPASYQVLYHYGITLNTPITFQKSYNPRRIMQVGEIPVKTFEEMFQAVYYYHYNTDVKRITFYCDEDTTFEWEINKCKAPSIKQYDDKQEKWVKTTRPKFLKDDSEIINTRKSPRLDKKRKFSPDKTDSKTVSKQEFDHVNKRRRLTDSSSSGSDNK